jgi:YVTN family beta-propeller protein
MPRPDFQDGLAKDGPMQLKHLHLAFEGLVFIAMALAGATGLHASGAAISVGLGPVAVAVNPVTNKVYVAPSGSSTVTVIHGATHTTATVNVGGQSTAIAVNPATNKVYVVTPSLATLAVIDGATDRVTAQVNVGTHALAVAVNPVTNKIYVANTYSNAITVVNGVDNGISRTINVSSPPTGMAINPVTSQIYVTMGLVNALTVIDGTNPSEQTFVPLGYAPDAMAVNPVTNMVYLARFGDDFVTAIQGATDTKTKVMVGLSIAAMAINPVTNRVYVADQNSATVTVINGPANTTTVINGPACTPLSGATPQAIAVNAVTNRVYAANPNAGTVTVIDGATNVPNTVRMGSVPYAIAIDPVTDRVYVANRNSGTVTVIDGASNATVNVPVGAQPQAMAIDPGTNQVYVANTGAKTITVIDGASNVPTQVDVDLAPTAIAVNPETHKVYVAGKVSGLVTILDATTLARTTLSGGPEPAAIAIDPVTGSVYVANQGSGTVTVIDGTTNNATTVAGFGPASAAIGINPATNRVYVADAQTDTLTVLDVDGSVPVPVTLTATGTDDALTVSNSNLFATMNRDPGFTVAATSGYAGSAAYAGLPGLTEPTPSALYFRVDGAGSGPWTQASLSSSAPGSATFTLTLAGQSVGLHTLYLFAGCGGEAVAARSGNGPGSTPEISNFKAVTFVVLPVATTTTLSAVQNPQQSGTPVQVSATVAPYRTEAAGPSGSVSFFDGSRLLKEVTLDPVSLKADCSIPGLAVGTDALSAIYSGDARYGDSTGTLAEQIVLTTGVPSYAISFSTDGTPGATLTGSTSQTIPSGGAATAVTANAPAGFVFVNWTGSAGFPTSTANPLTLTPVTAAYVIKANFSADGVLITGPSVPILSVPASGGSATTAITLRALQSVANPVTLSASGLPAGATCSFSTITMNLSTSPVPVSVTITVAPALTLARTRGVPPLGFGSGAGGLLACGVLAGRRRRRMGLFLGALLLVVLGGMTACGSGNGTLQAVATSQPRPAAGTYRVTLTCSSAQGVPEARTSFQLSID